MPMLHVTVDPRNLDDITPGDILAYVFAACGREKIPSRMKTLQDAIRRLRRNQDFGKILDCFIFSRKVDVYPFSRLLAATIQCLVFGNIIARDPFDEDSYVVNLEARKRELAEAPGRFGDDLPVFQAIANQFAAELDHIS